MSMNHILVNRFLLVFAFFASASCYAANVDSLLKEGTQLCKSFENLKALGKFEQAYELDSNSYKTISKLTKIYNDISGEYKEQRKDSLSEKYVKLGVKLAEMFHDKFPDSSLTYTYLAWSYGGLAKLVGSKEKIKLAKKIEENAKKSIQINPNDFMPYLILGVYYREIANLSWIERFFANTFFGDVPDGSYEDSEKMLKKALAFDPKIIIANYELANTLLQEDKEKDAISLYNELLKIPNNDFRDKYIKEKTRRRLERLKS